MIFFFKHLAMSLASSEMGVSVSQSLSSSTHFLTLPDGQSRVEASSGGDLSEFLSKFEGHHFDVRATVIFQDLSQNTQQFMLKQIDHLQSEPQSKRVSFFGDVLKNLTDNLGKLQSELSQLEALKAPKSFGPGSPRISRSIRHVSAVAGVPVSELRRQEALLNTQLLALDKQVSELMSKCESRGVDEHLKLGELEVKIFELLERYCQLDQSVRFSVAHPTS